MGIMERIATVGEDVLTLDVATFTGTVEIGLDGDGFDFSRLVASLKEQAARAEGTVKLVALTHVELDRDVIHFVKEGLTEPEEKLTRDHEAMVEIAKDGRMGFLRFVRDLF